MAGPVQEVTPWMEYGVAGAPLVGQRESGDAYVFQATGDLVLAAVVDGLGHGQEAARAARVAADTLQRGPEQSVITLVRHCHAALLGTRGVAMSLASINAGDDTMTWLAIGNVEGVLIRADQAAVPAREAILMRGGVVGFELPLLRASVTSLTRGDTLVLATDGIRPSFVEALHGGLPAQRLADSILSHHGKNTDDALVLVARYLGRPGPP